MKCYTSNVGREGAKQDHFVVFSKTISLFSALSLSLLATLKSYQQDKLFGKVTFWVYGARIFRTKLSGSLIVHNYTCARTSSRMFQGGNHFFAFASYSSGMLLFTPDLIITSLLSHHIKLKGSSQHAILCVQQFKVDKT